jgi:hypothetical protein
MRFKAIASIFLGSLLAASLSIAQDKNELDKNEQSRQKIRKMAAQTLQDLYKVQPAAKAAIQKSAGHAVFNNTGTTSLC